MSQDLQKLISQLPPPESPVETGDLSGWADIEARLKSPLPSDYKQFIGAYGTGAIDEFLVVWNPFAANNNVNFIQAGSRALDADAESKTHFPHLYPHALFPNAGGLLPFGATDNGNTLYWKTEGNPEDWTVVVFEPRGPSFYSFNGSMVAFLGGVLDRAIRCTVFPTSFPSRNPRFQSFG